MIIAGIKRFIKKEAHNTAPFSFGKNRKHSNIRICLALATIMLCLHIVGGAATPALACGLCDLPPNFMQDTTIENYISNEHNNTQQNINNHTDKDFQSYEDWIVNDFFKQYILPAMMQMAGQMSAVAMQQMEILGTFLDAKHQMETNRLFQELAAQAHRDYQPSEGMCTIGTSVRSLAHAERNADQAALVLSQRSIERQLMNKYSSGSRGQKTDKKSREEQFKAYYCDKTDNNNGLAAVCASSVPITRVNKDIDFNKTLWSPLSLNINLADATSTPDEQDIMALQSNLYANSIFEQPISYDTLKYSSGNERVYMDMRALVAKRSVAENSFEALAAMKSQGTTSSANTAQYLQAAIQQLNPSITAAQAKNIIGTNPSYYAQMEILTKKLIQNPQFFTDLYETPANVERKSAALQAISMMQARDDFKSDLRTEATLSVLLELEVENAQRKVQEQIDNMSQTGAH